MKTLWIARDKMNNELYLFSKEPERVSDDTDDEPNIWICKEDFGYLLWLDPESYPSVTWENSPQQVELKLKERGNDL